MTVLTYVFLIIATAGVFSVLAYCLAAGLRNGDRPGDVKVTAVLTTGTQPDETRPLIVVSVRNPSGTPVFAALTARRALLPAGLASAHVVTVPRWTLRRKFRPQQYAAVGMAPAGGAAELAVPVVARSRRYLLTAVVGQEAGRLRVHRLRLGPVSHAVTGRHELFPTVPPR
jgi:hypothetical protein